MNFLLCLVSAIFAFMQSTVAEPNYVKTTTYKENGTEENISVSYSDGLGRPIQSLVKRGSKSIYTGTYYNDAGLPYKTFRSFSADGSSYIDMTGTTFLDKAKKGILFDANGNSVDVALPYSETAYWNDPLQRVKWSFGVDKVAHTEGAENNENADNHAVRSWYFGVATSSDFVDNPTISILDSKQNATNAKYFLTVTRDAVGNYSQSISDIFGMVLKTKSDPDKTKSNDEIVAEYQYDILGNVLREIPPGITSLQTDGHTKYEYNTLGQLTKKTSPDAGTVEYLYDKAGRLKFVRNAEHLWQDGKYPNEPKHYLVYIYDALGRNVAMGMNNSSDPFSAEKVDMNDVSKINMFVKSFYDAHLLKMQYAYQNGVHVHTSIFTYDDEDRLIEKTSSLQNYNFDDNFRGNSITYFYTYNFENQLVGIRAVDAMGFDVEIASRTFIYDAFGRLSEVKNGTKILVRYSYDKLDNLENKAFNNGINGYLKTVYSYKAQGWIDNISSPRFSEAMRYNADGNINSATFIYQATEKLYKYNYTYDGVNRLTNVSLGNETTGPLGSTESFNYDSKGRFISKTKDSKTSTYDYVPYKNQLNKTSNHAVSKNYIYNKNGAIVCDMSRKCIFELDWRDLITSIKFYSAIPASVTSYDLLVQEGLWKNSNLVSEIKMTYDASGNRIAKQTINYK